MKTPPATPARVRLTISVSPEVHETFTRMAAASGQSVSRAMGDWLADTLDAADQAATMMARAREAPRLVARELHSYALGMVDETSSVLETMRTGTRATARAAITAAGTSRRSPSPPSGNTGGKVPRKGPKKGGRKRA